MSSNARRTVLFPEPEMPVRMTSWRPAFLAFLALREGRFTFVVWLALYPALVRTGNSHIFAVFRHGPAGDVDSVVVQFLGDLLVGQRLAAIFFINHFLD